MTTRREGGPGTVFLVGAGPGDPGLITVAGAACLRAADVVLYDRLVGRRLLAMAPHRAESIDVGKATGDGRDRQEAINALMIEKAKAGNRVVRLKGGDPFVFGRGGEEAAALAGAGVPYRVVPGVTSAVAAPAYAGIPLTHRGYASSFTVLTGSESPDKEDSAIAWDEVAGIGGTVVVLMGWERLEEIVNALVAGGRPADTPAAVVQWGSGASQRTVAGTLADIAGKARGSEMGPPAAVVVGEVVRLRDRLRWFDSGPLFGKRVLVTRSRRQAGALSEMLSLEGAEVVEAPAIEVRPLDDTSELDEAVRDLSLHRWAVFTSANAVDAVFDRLAALSLDARALRDTRVAAIGAATAARLRERGIAADLVPREPVSTSMAEALRGHVAAGDAVFLPQADVAGEELRAGLSRAGADVRHVVAYRTVMPDASRELVSAALDEGIDVATFTSSSTVRNFVRLIDGDVGRLGGALTACIGPVTAAAAREHGMDARLVAETSTVAGLVDAIKAHYREEDPK